MRGKKAKLIRTLVREGQEERGNNLPDVKHGARKIRASNGTERHQFVVHPECIRYHIKQLKKFVIALSRNTTKPKPIKNVGFGSRRKARNQAIRRSIPKFNKQGELIHNV